MSDPFFLPSKAKAKRKAPEPNAPSAPAAVKEKRPRMTMMPSKLNEEDDGSATTMRDEEENADERRMRIARQYLESVKEEMGGEDADEDEVAARLRSEVVEASGRAFHPLAERLKGIEGIPGTVRGGHKGSVTCVAVTDDGRTAFSGSKDGTIVRWDVETGKRICALGSSSSSSSAAAATTKKRTGKGHEHTAHVMALALTSDGRVLASGGEDKHVHIWDTVSGKEGEALSGHRDTVSALSFRQNSRQLFSASHDRTVKVWNADSMAYVETLFGHQSAVSALDCLDRERAISAGADCTVRIWKVVEESQLVFRGHSSAIESVALVNESMFITGSQDGAVSLWLATKKAPVDFRSAAHGGNWVSSVAACKRTDIAASGSSDGFIQLWKAGNRRSPAKADGDDDSEGADSRTPSLPGLTPLQRVPASGFVNSMAFSRDGNVLVAGMGQEHKLGRWTRDKAATNGVMFVPLSYNNEEEEDSGDDA